MSKVLLFSILNNSARDDPGNSIPFLMFSSPCLPYQVLLSAEVCFIFLINFEVGIKISIYIKLTKNGSAYRFIASNPVVRPAEVMECYRTKLPKSLVTVRRLVHDKKFRFWKIIDLKPSNFLKC